jgi:phosphatidylinositol alpha-1,6-mannosyltransferase
VALTHGHESWWATLPGSRRLLRRIGDEVDVLTTISDYVTARIAAALSPGGRAKLVRLPPPVDLDVFVPGPCRSGEARDPTSVGRRTPAAAEESRNPTSVGKRTTRETAGRVIAVGRMVRRKGFDTLVRAWALMGETTPAPRARRPYELVLVGDGPERPRLERQVARHRLSDVRFTGALDPSGVLAQLQAADVLAFPVRTRLGGLDREGLGLAPLEAAACGLPVVVGRSGGAPETVEHGRTGYVVDPDDPYELAGRLVDLLADPVRAGRMGVAGRRLVTEHYGAVPARQVLRRALGLDTV